MLKIFIDYNENEICAFHTFVRQAYDILTFDFSIYPLKTFDELGEHGHLKKRLLCPYLCDFKGQALYIDLKLVLDHNMNELVSSLTKSVGIYKLPAQLDYGERLPHLYTINENLLAQYRSRFLFFQNSKCKELTPYFIKNIFGRPLNNIVDLGGVKIKEVSSSYNFDYFSHGEPWFEVTYDKLKHSSWMEYYKKCMSPLDPLNKAFVADNKFYHKEFGEQEILLKDITSNEECFLVINDHSLELGKVKNRYVVLSLLRYFGLRKSLWSYFYLDDKPCLKIDRMSKLGPVFPRFESPEAVWEEISTLAQYEKKNYLGLILFDCLTGFKNRNWGNVLEEDSRLNVYEGVLNMIDLENEEYSLKKISQLIRKYHLQDAAAHFFDKLSPKLILKVINSLDLAKEDIESYKKLFSNNFEVMLYLEDLVGL